MHWEWVYWPQKRQPKIVSPLSSHTDLARVYVEEEKEREREREKERERKRERRRNTDGGWVRKLEWGNWTFNSRRFHLILHDYHKTINNSKRNLSLKTSKCFFSIHLDQTQLRIEISAEEIEISNVRFQIVHLT